jgi:hypothetical protein
MERADALQKLKKGVFPDGFLELYPKVSALIIWMMNEKPEDRPNASHLLNFEFPLPASEDDKNTALQLQLQANRLALQHKNKKIDELTKKVALIEHEKTQAIDEMQRKIDELQRQLDIIQGVGSKVHLLKQSPSFSKKKKEVRWSSVHAPIISKFQ